MPKLISLAEAARLSGLSADHLRKLAQQGKIQAEKIGRDWLTTEEAVREYQKLGIKRGRKPRKSV